MSTNIKLETCYTCNKEISPTVKGSTKFDCPNCGTKIIRCHTCRRLGNRYKCINCEFVGP